MKKFVVLVYILSLLCLHNILFSQNYTVSLPDSVGEVGDEILVPLVLQDISWLTNYLATDGIIQFDPNIIFCDSIYLENSLLEDAGMFIPTINNSTGEVLFNGASTGADLSSESGVWFFIKFVLLSNGVSELDIVSFRVANNGNWILPTTIIDGSIEVGENFISHNNSFDSKTNEQAMLEIYPNPFNPSTTISYFLAQGSFVQLDIYNHRGRKVINLINSYQNKGLHQVFWNGKTADSYRISSGLYFCKISAQSNLGKIERQRKLLMMK